MYKIRFEVKLDLEVMILQLIYIFSPLCAELSEEETEDVQFKEVSYLLLFHLNLFTFGHALVLDQ